LNQNVTGYYFPFVNIKIYAKLQAAIFFYFFICKNWQLHFENCGGLPRGKNTSFPVTHLKNSLFKTWYTHFKKRTHCTINNKNEAGSGGCGFKKLETYRLQF